MAPELVRGIVAVEPSGPPFRTLRMLSDVRAKERGHGLTTELLRYEPAVALAAPLEFERDPKDEAYWKPKGGARRLACLAGGASRCYYGASIASC